MAVPDHRGTLAASFLALLGLAGCAHDPAEVEPDPPAAIATGGDKAVELFLRANRACQIDGLDQLIGDVATPETIARAQAESGALSVRIDRPGEPISQEGMTGRLAIEVDRNNRIVQFSCG